MIIMKVIRRLYRIFITIISDIIATFFIVLGWSFILMKKPITEVSLLISRIPFSFGDKLRYFYYKSVLKKVGKNVTFKYGSFCQYRNTIIGNRVLIGYFNTLGEVAIGNDVVVGGNVNFLSGLQQHSFEDKSKLITKQPAQGRKMIHIGSDVWIGSDSVIGNDIGNRCVIATVSVVVKKVEDHSLVGGNPAKFIKSI